MPQSELKQTTLARAKPSAGWLARVQFSLLLLCFLNAGWVAVRLYLPRAWFSGAIWPEGLWLVLATGSTLASLTGQVPGQNTILAALVIGSAAGAAHCLSVITGIPLGPVVDQAPNLGGRCFDCLPWTIPLIWTVALLNARGVGRLMLRRYRSNPYYGFWLMGTTVLLMLLFELGWQPYAVNVKHYWSWAPPPFHFGWYAVPWSHFLGCGLVCTAILVCVTPLLINKSPQHPPLSYHPLLIWEMLNSLLLTGTILNRLWGVACLIGGQMIVVAVLSLVASQTRLGGKGQG